jgi:geranylgeranyl diphosphate synthase, type II
MEKDIEIIQREVLQFIDQLELDREPAGLYAPVAYCLQNGGKRMRPVMTLLACDLFGGDTKQALPAAIGLELFHNFTLLHDDIMDNAPLRRNRPTVHVKWDVNTAILSGDLMYALAYKYVGQVPDAALRPVIELFNKTVIEVCEGQQYDMDFENRNDVSVEEYLKMIRLKTAVLPAACLQTGAIIAGASEKDQQTIYRFGEYIGLAFQLRDDWLDVYGDIALFGKKPGGDIIANKKTWLYIHALEMARDDHRKTLQAAFNNEIIDDDEKVSIVKDIYNHLDINALAQKSMKEYYIRAFDCLETIALPENRKQKLKDLAEMLLNRDR